MTISTIPSTCRMMTPCAMMAVVHVSATPSAERPQMLIFSTHSLMDQHLVIVAGLLRCSLCKPLAFACHISAFAASYYTRCHFSHEANLCHAHKPVLKVERDRADSILTRGRNGQRRACRPLAFPCYPIQTYISKHTKATNV